jgi:hypothetical protein
MPALRSGRRSRGDAGDHDRDACLAQCLQFLAAPAEDERVAALHARHAQPAARMLGWAGR